VSVMERWCLACYYRAIKEIRAFPKRERGEVGNVSLAPRSSTTRGDVHDN
jgi:hypothetical protein